MPPSLVALYSSSPACGKSTVANHLDSHGYELIKFATPLKGMIKVFLKHLGIKDPEDYIEGPFKETPVPGLPKPTDPRDIPLTFRYLAQTLGTEWGRGLVCPNLWVDITAGKLDRRGSSKIVVDDMRFPNEYLALKNRGAFMIKIIRKTDGGPVGIKGHKSEGSLCDYKWDLEVVNDGTVSELKAKVDKALGI